MPYLEGMIQTRKERASGMSDSESGVHVWLVLLKAFQAMMAHSEESIAGCGLGQSDFRVMEVLLHKGPLPVNTIGPKVFLTPGSISSAVDRLYTKGLVSRTESAEDRRVRTVELTAVGHDLISKIFSRHKVAMEAAAAGLTRPERIRLVALLKKMGKFAAVASTR